MFPTSRREIITWMLLLALLLGCTFITQAAEPGDTTTTTTSPSSTTTTGREQAQSHQFQERKTKTILLTGGAGFVGSHVAEYLLQRGDRVVLMDEVNDYYNVSIKESNLALLTSRYDEQQLTIVRADICNERVLGQVFAAHSFCLLYTSPSPRDGATSRMPSSA